MVQVEEMIKKLDSSGDGQLSMEEFNALEATLRDRTADESGSPGVHSMLLDQQVPPIAHWAARARMCVRVCVCVCVCVCVFMLLYVYACANVWIDR